MYDRLFDYVEKYSGMELSPSDKETIRQIWEPHRIRKKEYILRVGEVCLHASFIISGALRRYTVDDQGIEHINDLAIENWWLIDRDSFMNGLPSKTYIDAWEPTQILRLNRADLDTALQIPAIKEMFWQMNQRNQIANESRLNDLSSLSAAKRCENFIDKHPTLLQRFPQHIIASYLGIRKETLSRIRSNQLRKR